MEEIIVAGAEEALKLGIQFLIAQARLNGLNDAHVDAIIQTERERFRKNISEPLPDV